MPNAMNPATAFMQGRAARQEYDYGQSRNALAQMEVQNAPTETANRNALAQQHLTQGSQAIQSGQMGIDQENAKIGYTRLAQALQSGNPKAYVLQREPELVQKLAQHGVDLNSMDDAQAAQILDGVAREYAGKAGIAPAAKPVQMETIERDGALFQRDPTTNALKQVAAADHFRDAEAGRNGRAQFGGGAGGYDLLTPEEVAAAGLPKGTVAQRNAGGRINILKKPDASGGGAKLSEGDKRARVSFNSILNAEKDISKIDGVDSSSGVQNVLGSTALTKGAQSDEYKRYRSAAQRWAANLLYLKSGATATPDEINSTWEQFFPQFGDGEPAKAQKAAARNEELRSIAQVYGLDQEQIPGITGQQAPQQPQQPAQRQPITIASDQEYDQLRSGDEFIGPDGQRRRKP
jgi:hypothetical protein